MLSTVDCACAQLLGKDTGRTYLPGEEVGVWAQERGGNSPPHTDGGVSTSGPCDCITNHKNKVSSTNGGGDGKTLGDFCMAVRALSKEPRTAGNGT